jgi:sortase (surface protein transpeptidase)
MKHLNNLKVPVTNRIIKTISIIMIVSGVMLVLYPFLSHCYSIAWQAKITREFESDRNRVKIQLPETGQQQKMSKKTRATDLLSEETKALSKEPDLSASKPPKKNIGLAILEIPAINLTATVVEGTSKYSLAKGPGWYSESALPGEGNTAMDRISGFVKRI